MSFANRSGAARYPDTDHCHISEENRSLAVKLSGHLGMDGALTISAKNEWHGVLAALTELQKKRR